jgi:predicted DCC family thiol-disulfide oxidoreductase YuxK
MRAFESVLIFDGDCAFCSSSARLLKRLTKNRIPVEPFQYLPLADYDLNQELTSKAVYYVTPNENFVAARAIARALIDSKTPWALAGFLLNLPVIVSFAELVYYWVAKNRHRLPGGTPECALRLPPKDNRGQ